VGLAVFKTVEGATSSLAGSIPVRLRSSFRTRIERMTEPPFVAENDRARAALRALVERLSDEQLRRPVNDAWTIAGVLAHVAFWDARVEYLVHKHLRGAPFTPDDEEPEDVDWINEAARPFMHALVPRVAATISLEIAERTDALIASIPADQMYPADPASPINAVRATHRLEHVEEIVASLG
jgi:hypothetical protein